MRNAHVWPGDVCLAQETESSLDFQENDAHAASRRKQGAWRNAALYAQIERALTAALDGEIADERLEGLCIESVERAPGSRATWS